MRKIAGVVVLYNPGKSIPQNIDSYIRYVDVLFVVDNSEEIAIDMFEALKINEKIRYLANNENLGIAKVLNQIVIEAIEQGYEWLLTMDQDSYYDDIQAEAYFTCFARMQNLEKTAIFSLLHDKNKIAQQECYVEPLTVMMSGNLLNLKLCVQTGMFNEDLFIDYVDTDYCLRAKLLGYKIIMCQHIYLTHFLGVEKKIIEGDKIRVIVTYPPIRFYYIARNVLYMWKTYRTLFPIFTRNCIMSAWANRIKTAIFVEKDIKKLILILNGILDFFRGKYGKKVGT